MRKETEQVMVITNFVGYVMAATVLLYIVMAEAVNLMPNIKQRVISYTSHFDFMKNAALALAVACYPAVLYFRRKKIKTAAGLSAAISSMYTNIVISFMLCELPAVLGIVLFFYGGSRAEVYTFSGLSLLLFFMFFPRKADWENLDKHIKG